MEPITSPTQQRDIKKNRHIAWVMYVVMLLIAGAISLLVFWALQNQTVLEIKNAPFPLRTIRDNAQPNGVVILNTDYCKHKEITGRLRMSFVSASREVFLPVTEERTHKGCFTQEVPVLLPKDLPVDIYVVKFRVTYDINPLKRDVPIEFQSKEFKVVESGDIVPHP